MKGRLYLCLVLSALAFVGAVWIFLLLAGPRQETLDQRVHDVGSQLKCPVCRGESVADSSVLIAQQMRLVIRQQLQQGKSDQEIIQYFEDKYGAEVTWSPPWQGFTLLAWIVPIALLLGGVGLLFSVLREWQTSAPAVAVEPLANKDIKETALADPDLERYRIQLEEELAQEDILFSYSEKEGALMAIVIAIALGLLSLAFVLYPLYAHPAAQSKVTARKDEPARDAVDAPTMAEQEQNARTALQEVELDYQLGNIEEPDYRTLRERYMQRALVALKSRYENEQEIDEEIEAQLRKLKEEHEKTDS